MIAYTTRTILQTPPPWADATPCLAMAEGSEDSDEAVVPLPSEA
jgi:hypothetical protein